MNANWSRVANAIRDELERRGWTQEDLAEATGVGERSVARLVDPNRQPRGIPPSIYPVQRAFGWPPNRVSELLEGKPFDSEPAVPMSEVVEDLLEHLDRQVAKTRGRKRREYEERARTIRARLSKFRDGDGG